MSSRWPALEFDTTTIRNMKRREEDGESLNVGEKDPCDPHGIL